VGIQQLPARKNNLLRNNGKTFIISSAFQLAKYADFDKKGF
jgi:hypothetical protein